MSVLLETSAGEMVIDLYTDECPQTCLNFLKLCKLKYYNFCPFWNVQKDFMVQTGDPTATGKGGESLFGIIDGPSRRYFPAEVKPHLKHKRRGTVSMAVAGDASTTGVSGSQFFITTADDLDYLDGKYTVFGYLAEGWDTLARINDSICDDAGRPLKDVRIRHTVVLDDPFPDPPGLRVPSRSPEPTREALDSVLRIAEDEEIEDDRPPEEIEREVRDQEAKAQALTLEMVGDLPFAEIKPPENVLFVCKLNPVTRDEDLELIFSRFGTINSCEVIRDKKTGDSLSYAFVEFEDREACEEAYFKMQNCLIDERRIKVDFSQSVSKLHANWISGRRQQAGYGGSANLMKRSRYRGQADRTRGEQYEMVFEPSSGSGVAGGRRADERQDRGKRRKSRSPTATTRDRGRRKFDERS